MEREIAFLLIIMMERGKKKHFVLHKTICNSRMLGKKWQKERETRKVFLKRPSRNRNTHSLLNPIWKYEILSSCLRAPPGIGWWVKRRMYTHQNEFHIKSKKKTENKCREENPLSFQIPTELHHLAALTHNWSSRRIVYYATNWPLIRHTI